MRKAMTMAQLWTDLLSIQSLIIYIGALGGILSALETRRRCEHWLKVLCVTQSGLFFMVLTICFQCFERDFHTLYLCSFYHAISLYSLVFLMFIILISMLEMDNIRIYSKILQYGAAFVLTLLFVCVAVHITTNKQLYKQFYNTTRHGDAVMDDSWMACDIISPLQTTVFAVEYLGMYFPILMLFAFAWRMRYRDLSARNQPSDDESKEPQVCCFEDISPHRCSSCDILDSAWLQLYVFTVIFVIRIYVILSSSYNGTGMRQIFVPMTILTVCTTVSLNVIRSSIQQLCGGLRRMKFVQHEKDVSPETMEVVTKS